MERDSLIVVFAAGLSFCLVNAEAAQFDFTSDSASAKKKVVQVPSSPAARRALAKRLVARFDNLSQHDADKLKALGDDAFPPLLSAFLKASREYDHKTKHRDSGIKERFSDLGYYLRMATSAKRSSDLMVALDSTAKDSSARTLLFDLLAEYSDPNRAIAYLLPETGDPKLPAYDRTETVALAREYVIHSTSPRAVALAIAWLKNPKANADLRREAYVHLAGTGGAAGLNAVLSDRHSRHLMRTPAERIEQGPPSSEWSEWGIKVLAQKADPSGRTFGLLRCGILGDAGDLWIAEKVKDKWIHPLFTGVTDASRRLTMFGKPATAPRFKGLSAKQLKAGAWFGIRNDPDLSRDSTNCGLTDLEKKRLCLDLAKADTDGDGDSDGVDPAPNAPRRSLSDAEQVLEAVFEARYHCDEDGEPALFAPSPGMSPFELIGRQGPTIWGSANRADPKFKPLADCWQLGTVFISFESPDLYLVGPKMANQLFGRGMILPNPRAARWEDRLIGWNPERTKASVVISTFYAELMGTGYLAIVKKFGTQWVVVDMEMAYIS